MSQPKTPPLPANRTWEQLRKHYEVEKEIAARLMAATREERREIYATMYDELFERIPDHSRLQIREDPKRTAQTNLSKWLLVKPFIDQSMTFVEFAPGSCRFAVEVCPHVHGVYGIDISDQSGQLESVPENFHLIIYNGYELDMEQDFADIVFSDERRRAMLLEFLSHHEQLAELVCNDDKAAFVERFREIQEFFGDFSEQALHESSYLIHRLADRFAQ